MLSSFSNILSSLVIIAIFIAGNRKKYDTLCFTNYITFYLLHLAQNILHWHNYHFLFIAINKSFFHLFFKAKTKKVCY